MRTWSGTLPLKRTRSCSFDECDSIAYRCKLQGRKPSVDVYFDAKIRHDRDTHQRDETHLYARRPLPRGLRWHSRQTTNEHRQNSLQRFVVLFDVVGIKIDSTPASNRLPQCVRIQHAFAAESGHSSFQLPLSK